MLENKYYNHVIFDLDGTISDPKEGVFNSIYFACNKMGIADYKIDEFDSFIGPPLHLSFQKRFDLSNQDSAKIVKFYREYYEEKGKFENVLYPGIKELLKLLFASGRIISIATSKPTYFTLQILDHFGISDCFRTIVGSNLDNTMSEKSEIIRKVLENVSSAHLDAIVMVGDSKFDIDGARINGLDSFGVLYGYGKKIDLQNAGATRLINTVSELSKNLLY